MANTDHNLGKQADENTIAMSPLVGLPREELLAAIGTVLKETARHPINFARHAGTFGKDVVDIVRGKSELGPEPKDKRFKDPTWAFNPVYRAGMQSWMALQKGLNNWVDDLELAELERARAQIVLNMITDALSPTNSLIGNPAALKRAYETGGLSLVKGLKNAYSDIVHNGGMPSQVDKRPFKVGENLALSEGAVVYRTEMAELIQYKPQTPEVYEIPVFMVPPQINKFYVSDLCPELSLVNYLTQLGHQVFIISWRNPTKEHAHWGLADYIRTVTELSDVAMKITGQKKLNITGACSGGITVSTLLSNLAAENDERVNTVTLQVCVLDPRRTDSEMGSLVNKRGLELARKRSAKKGVLEGSDLARMFAWLRPNDLVWNYVVNNYLLGEDPPAFNILYWNNDSTNLTAALHSDYLALYERQPFANQGTVDFMGNKIDLRKVKADTFIVAGMTDHITPWKACYRTTHLMGGNVKFVLSAGGHIQALLNPPLNPKAKFYWNEHNPDNPEEWLAGASEKKGSWWDEWAVWLSERSGAPKPAPKKLGNRKYPPIEAAPGSYVFE
ncbi:poly-beta-hydroxybutyrate polymerase domain-containing protein [Tepidicaulis marinus]|uniref:Poly-beta-hydroxybutyrate polymerase domain-containing protein n=1 Tax=Tepidicaulis marinus TaxID=1333998 RepID=A0A081B8M2_9HYPH|nr:alpha/beta fold hydrolase [Tepidicaulis marinus]GAK44390.1 poly-beta-hydroxybutyrate polymerase domain-containing protein [Tepidicaulis marinus]